MNMRSRKQDVAESNTSSVLFRNANGEPMCFFLRPGPIKRKLQPLIISGGGTLCSVQLPGAILLIDPEETVSIPETTAHWYVSTQYIYDCIEKDKQLNVEDYRLNPEVIPRHSARLNSKKEGSPGLSVGRVAYTPEDDAAILSYVSKHKDKIGGNRLWQEMEKECVTNHSWQSMKHHYKVQLAKKPSEVEAVKQTEEENKEEGTEETDIQKPSSEDAPPPQTHSPEAEPLETHSAETDLTQIDAQPMAAESTQPEDVDAGTSDSPQPVGPYFDQQADADLVPAESTEPQPAEPHTAEPQPAEPQTHISPQKAIVPEVLLQSPTDNFSPKNRKEKQRASPEPEQLQPRLTRRQGSLMPEPYSKRLRSSSTSAEKLSSPSLTKKIKAAETPAVKQHTTTDLPPSKRARRSVTEGQQEESKEATVSETSQPDDETNSFPQGGEKKKEKRKLGFLEFATKEFENESESSGDEASDLESPTEAAVLQPTSTEPPPLHADAATDGASTQSNPEPGPTLQEKAQQSQAVGSDCAPETGCSEPAASDTSAPEAFHAASRAHLFIFDSESQEEDSQPIVGDDTAALSNPQPLAKKDTAPSLTQVQLEEDKQRIRTLMKKTNQDIVTVTKALLKTSGEFSAALDLLLNPSSICGPFWSSCDDGILLPANPVLRQQLQEKYGEKEVAKRIVFLGLEG